MIRLGTTSCVYPLSRCLAFLLLLLATSAARPDDHYVLNEDQIKAGFLLNFMRFIEWPEQYYTGPSSPIIACIVGETSITALLAEAAAGKLISGHPVTVRSPKAADDLHPCHIVFIASTDDKHIQRVLDSLHGSSALTVGESPAFLRRGMINFVTQESKVKLEMNLDAATRANLKVSARLIAVSRLVNSKSPGGE